MSTPEEQKSFWISVIIITVFSTLGTLFTVIYIFIKFRREIPRRLVLNLGLADFGLSIICLSLCSNNYYHKNLPPEDDALCKFQPIITWYFMKVSILWLVIISFHSLLLIVYRKSFTKMQEIGITLSCWIIPLVTSLLPIGNTGESYGHRNGVWCSFKEKGAQLANISSYYFPSLVVIIFCYLRIIYEIYILKTYDEATRKKKLNKIGKLFAFVVCYFIVWSPLEFMYIYEFVNNRYVPFWVEYWDNILHMQGVFYFIIYGVMFGLFANVFYKTRYTIYRLQGKSIENPEQEQEMTSVPNSASSYSDSNI